MSSGVVARNGEDGVWSPGRTADRQSALEQIGREFHGLCAHDTARGEQSTEDESYNDRQARATRLTSAWPRHRPDEKRDRQERESRQALLRRRPQPENPSGTLHLAADFEGDVPAGDAQPADHQRQSQQAQEAAAPFPGEEANGQYAE